MTLCVQFLKNVTRLSSLWFLHAPVSVLNHFLPLNSPSVTTTLLSCMLLQKKSHCHDPKLPECSVCCNPPTARRNLSLSLVTEWLKLNLHLHQPVLQQRVVIFRQLPADPAA